MAAAKKAPAITREKSPVVSDGATPDERPVAAEPALTAAQQKDVTAALGDLPERFAVEQEQGYVGSRPDHDDAVIALKHSGRLPA